MSTVEQVSTPSALAGPVSCDFVVFGGTGDLALRKLLPALFLRDAEHQLADDTRIIGVSRAEADDDAYRTEVRASLAAHVPDAAAPAVDRFLARLHHVPLEFDDPDDWHLLQGLLKKRPLGEADPVRVYYLAVAPSLFGVICDRLEQVGAVDERSRVVMEKPIGHDLASAREVNDAVGRVFDESQVFRIDHYLGKESVQNLLVTRFANTFLEPVWNAHWIDHVQITVAESLGVGSRGGYYDRAGALRDMVQNHLLQLLCLVAMEPPTVASREDVRDEKLKVLKALKPMTRRRGRPRHGPRQVRRRPRRRHPRPVVRRGGRCRGHAHRDLRGAEGRGQQLALGRGAVLPADRQAHGPTALRDRRGLQAAAARDVPAQ